MRVRMIMAAAAAALAAPGAGAMAPSCTPMEMRHGRPFVTISLNGATTRALVDTGAEATVVDAAYARKAGLEKGASTTVSGSGGTEEAHALPEVALVVAGRRIAGVRPYAIDLSDVAARLFKEKVAVVLGRELFDAERVTLDFAGGKLCLVDRAVEPVGARLSLEEARGLVSIPIEIEGKPVRADIDTGNSGALLLGAAFVEANGFLTDGRKIGVNRGGGIGGAIVRQRFVTRSVTIAGETIAGAAAVVDPLPNAGPANIGSALLRRFLVTLDYRENRAWFAKYN